MKKQIKLAALVLALLMVLSCLFACGMGSKVKPESVTDKYNEQEYAKLKDSSDKLLWVPENDHPAAAKVASLAGIGDGEKGFFGSLQDELKSFEGNMELSLDKLTDNGEDTLEQLGGPLKLTGRVLTGEKAVNGNLSIAVGEMSIDVKLAADESGIILESPFLFTKPVFVSADQIASLLESAAKTDGQDINLTSASDNFDSMDDLLDISKLSSMLYGVSDWSDGLKKWNDEKLTKENIDHIRELVKSCVPEQAIAVSNVTPPELKGEFITFDVETECVELKLTSETAQKFLQDLLQAVKEDTVIKDVTVSLLEVFGDEFIESLTGEAGKTADELYDELIEQFCDKSDDASEPDNEDKGIFTVRRYFAGGRDVKTDIIFSEDGTKDNFNCTFWNAYANTNANEFGVQLSANGSEYINIVGGSNETDAKLEGTITIPDTDKDGANLGTVKLSAVREGKKVQAKVDFNIAGSEETGASKGKLTFDGDKNACSLKASLSSGATVISLNASGTANGSTDVYEAEFSMDEGNGPQTLKLRCEDNKTQTNEKTEHSCKIKLTATDTTEVEATLVLSLDKASKNTPEVPAKDGAFELTETVTEEQLEEILSPQFVGLLSGFGGYDDDEDPEGELFSTEPSGTYDLIRVRTGGEETDFEELSVVELDDSYITFNDDGTGEIYMDDDSTDGPIQFCWEDNDIFVEQDSEAFIHYELDEADVVTIFIDGDDECMEIDFRLS